jgi:hypothetical protein
MPLSRFLKQLTQMINYCRFMPADLVFIVISTFWWIGLVHGVLLYFCADRKDEYASITSDVMLQRMGLINNIESAYEVS